MKTKLLLGILALILSASLLQSVSAYHENNFYGTEYGYDGGFYSNDYRYVDFYGYPQYRIYEDPFFGNRYNSYNRYDRKDLEWDFDRRRAVAWVLNSYDQRYRQSSGFSTGSVYCQNCVNDGGVSSFGNAIAYDYRFDGKGAYQDGYYYQPRFDPQLGYYNWKY